MAALSGPNRGRDPLFSKDGEIRDTIDDSLIGRWAVRDFRENMWKLRPIQRAAAQRGHLRGTGSTIRALGVIRFVIMQPTGFKHSYKRSIDERKILPEYYIAQRYRSLELTRPLMVSICSIVRIVEYRRYIEYN